MLNVGVIRTNGDQLKHDWTLSYKWHISGADPCLSV